MAKEKEKEKEKADPPASRKDDNQKGKDNSKNSNSNSKDNNSKAQQQHWQKLWQGRREKTAAEDMWAFRGLRGWGSCVAVGCGSIGGNSAPRSCE